MTKKYAFKKGFTLAEVMIVLTVIGVLTAILLPVARQSMPDENLMKFKKAHNTLGTVIRELVTSDKYYLDGDLSKKNDNSDVDVTYLCKTMSDLLNVKEENCSEYDNYKYSHNRVDWEYKGYPDDVCYNSQNHVGDELILSDGVVFFQGSPAQHFAYRGVRLSTTSDDSDESYASDEAKNRLLFGSEVKTDDGFLANYKIFCIDIDGTGKGEEPFGYGIRIDGKILAGPRAQQWLERDVNEE